MKKIFIIFVISIIIGISIFMVKSYNDTNKTIKPPLTQTQDSNSQTPSNNTFKDNTLKVKAPNITLKDLNGSDVSLAELKGKMVYLNFWATWCPPCRNEMPDIEKLYEETKDTNLVILAVNLGEDKKKVQSFINQNKYNYKILLDTDKTAAELYKIEAIPSSFFIDKDGNIIAQKVGGMDKSEMKSYIEKLK